MYRPVLSYSKSFNSFIATFLYFCCQYVLGRILLIVFQTVRLKELDEIYFKKLIIRSFLTHDLSLDSHKLKSALPLSGPLRRRANDTSPHLYTSSSPAGCPEFFENLFLPKPPLQYDFDSETYLGVGEESEGKSARAPRAPS